MGELTRDAIALAERQVTEAIQKGRAKPLEPATVYTLMKAFEAAEARVAALRDRVERAERALGVQR